MITEDTISQSYVDQGTTEAMYNYQVTTDTPTTTILSKPTEGTLTLAEMKNGRYKRVIIVRYTGSVREIILEDYQLFKGELAKGIYQPYEFTWYLVGRDGKTADQLNSDTAKSIIERVDGPLQQSVRGWFARELPNIGPTATLAVDIPNYISPLRT
jgi:hypothetical protein